jgi:hypothetical protein
MREVLGQKGEVTRAQHPDISSSAWCTCREDRILSAPTTDERKRSAIWPLPVFTVMRKSRTAACPAPSPEACLEPSESMPPSPRHEDQLELDLYAVRLAQAGEDPALLPDRGASPRSAGVAFTESA